MNRGHALKRLYATITLPILMIGLGLGLATWAHAQQNQGFTAQLAMLNDSGATGTATATLVGDQLTIKIHSTGLTPNQPHAQHLHIGGTHTCPTIAADTNKDGLISTVEGQPSYGPIMVSLTTTGDVTASSGLAVDRFPKADANGVLDYERTFTLPAGVTADDVAQSVVVQHGVDVNKSGAYDGTAKSELDPSLPLEATLPADCGKSAASAAAGSPTATGGAAPSTAAAAPTAQTGVTSAPNTGDGATAGQSGMMLEIELIAGIVIAFAGAGVALFGVKRLRA
ncbi:MAG TPA: hypothetical protein VIE40_04020 [Dehalococcoidia bacterium]|jgi:hypothetical protein